VIGRRSSRRDDRLVRHVSSEKANTDQLTQEIEIERNKNHETDKDSSQFNSMTKLSTKLKEEFFALLPPTIFFSWLCISSRLFAC